LMLIFI